MRYVLGIVLIASVFVSTLPLSSATAQTADGSVYFVVFGGGNVSALVSGSGTTVSAVWVTVDGELFGYIPGAPDVVNASFVSGFPGAMLPPSTPAIIITPAGAAPPRTSIGTPTRTPTSVSTSVPVPTATPAPAAKYTPVSVTRVVSGSATTGIRSSDGLPMVGAYADCSTSSALIGGWYDGSTPTVVGLGINACVGWTYLVSPGGEYHWVFNAYLATAAAAPPAPVAPVSPVAPTTQTAIRTCISGEFTGWDGDSIFDLCNGQVWVQASYDYTYTYMYGPSVTIIRTSYGWSMSVDGVRGSIAVEPATEVLRSSISGSFNGWNGSTIVTLSNGQVWRQADYRLKLALRLSPRVLIYKTSGPYRMKVDGVDGTVAVTRIR